MTFWTGKKVKTATELCTYITTYFSVGNNEPKKLCEYIFFASESDPYVWHTFWGSSGLLNAFDFPAVYTRLSIPSFWITSWNPSDCEITPIEPTIELLEINIFGAAVANQYPRKYVKSAHQYTYYVI